MKDTPSWLIKAVSIFDSDQYSDGDMLSHDWIKYALEIPPVKQLSDAENIQWLLLSRIDLFKDYLLSERKIALQNVRGKGYRIVPPSEQSQFAAEESMNLIQKGLKKGKKILENTRLAELDNESKKQHTDTSIRLMGVSELMKKEKKNIFKLFGPH